MVEYDSVRNRSACFLETLHQPDLISLASAGQLSTSLVMSCPRERGPMTTGFRFAARVDGGRIARRTGPQYQQARMSGLFST